MNVEIENEPGYCFVRAPWHATGQIPLDWFCANFSRFAVPRSVILANAVPYEFGDGPSAGGVYFLIADCEIVYVGLSNAICARLVQHVDTGKQFTHYWCIGGMPEMFVGDVESFYISYLSPPLNVLRRPPRAFISEMASKARSGKLFLKACRR